MKRTLNSLENKKMADWLLKKRLEKDLSMRALATLIKEPHSFIGKVEQQTRRLDVLEFITYCDALEADPKEFIDLIKSERN